MSKLATTIPFHIQPLSIMGIELGSQRWEASALSTTLLGHNSLLSLREQKKDRPLRARWGSSADRRDTALSSQIMRRTPSLFTSQTLRVSMCPSQGMRWLTRSFWFLLRWRRGRLYMSKSPIWHPVSPMKNGTPPLIWKLTRCIPVWASETSSTEW